MKSNPTPAISLSKLQSRTIQETSFRKLEPIDHWSGYVEVSNLNKGKFEKILQEVAKDVNIRISGWKIDDKNSDDFTYYICRHQRKKYGSVPPPEKYEEAIKKLAEKTGSKYVVENCDDKTGFRVLFGLRKGYDQASGDHDFNEVIKDLKEKEGFVNTKATILAAKPNGEIYTENAVLITGDLSKIDKIYSLADEYNQERFTIEDFSNQLNPITYSIETRHCTEPEK